MATVFTVVGEHRANPARFLLLGEDGRYYAYGAGGRPVAVEPGAHWILDGSPIDNAATSGTGR